MRFRLAILLVVLPLVISQMTWADDTKQKLATTERIKALPFGRVTPLPSAFALSADGRIAAHISINGDIVIWETSHIRTLEIIPSGDKQPSAVALSSDGNLIAIGYFDSRLIVRSRLEKKPLHEFYGHLGGISAIAFSSDGQMIASGGEDGTTQLWELASGKRLHVFDSMENGTPVSIGFSGDGQTLIVNEWYSRFYDVGRGTTIWDIKEGIEISTRVVAPPNADTAMRAGQALGGKGWLLAYTGEWLSDRTGLMVERIDQCESPLQMPAGGFADTVAADPLGRWVAATDSEKITFFGMSSDRKSYAIPLSAKAIALIAHPDGRSVSALMIADTRLNGNEHFIFGRDAETVTGGALYRISVPSQLLHLSPLSVKEDAAHCSPTEAMRKKQDFKLPDKPTELIAIAGNKPTWRELLAKKSVYRPWDTERQDNLGTISDIETGDVFWAREGYFERYASDGRRLKDVKINGTIEAFTARNGKLAALYLNGNVQVWQINPPGEVREFKLLKGESERDADGSAGDLALSADGRYLRVVFANASGDGPDVYLVYNLSSAQSVGDGELLAPFPRRANRGVVSDTRPHRLAVWDYDKNEIIARLPRHRSRDNSGGYQPLRAAISDDGRRVASASYDGLVRIWDIDAHQMVGEGRAGGEITAIVFDSAGQRLAAGRKDGQIVVFQIPEPK
jgi:WD40 repeat protein